MSKISNHQVKQINFTLIPEPPLIDIGDIDAGKLKDKIKDSFSGEDSKPIVTQFPGVVLIFDAITQVSINILQAENRIVVANNKPTNYNEQNITALRDLVMEISKEKCLKGLRAYGFNITSSFDLDGIEDSGKYISERFLLKDNLTKDINVSSAGIRLVFGEKEARVDLRIDPRYGEKLSPTNSINVGQNVHFESALPTGGALLEQAQNVISTLEQNLTKLFTEHV